eukprot:TRINITY_DN15551_c2_g1_i3.p1 TRINITY_DN15551_c2_g1~~TRINITY_DN15551_c2_g1_i3.p1  ORF type:complete len:360 (+),score=97.06 TRINITY_DN15551_c2_g1_i3:64-1080(+)
MTAPMLDILPLSEEVKPMLIGVMNGQYKEAVRLYAIHFCGQKADDVAAAYIKDLTVSAVTVQTYNADAVETEHTTPYVDAEGKNVTVATAGDCRRALVEMARIASVALNVDIRLPPAAASGPATAGSAAAAAAAAASAGYTGGSAAAATPSRVPGSLLLNNLIEASTMECLNQHDEHPVANMLTPEHDDNTLESDPDVDAQLLIRFAFRAPVKVSHICVFGSSEDESAPRSLRIFQGKPNIGFSEAEDEAPTQECLLEEADVNEGKPLQLRFVKFQNVSSLQIFVAENFGAEITRIRRLEVYGQPCQTMDMKEWAGSPELAREKLRKEAEKQLEKEGK